MDKKALETVHQLKTDEEQTLSTIFNHIASGGSLIDLCKLWDIPYWPIADWLNACPERAKKHYNALKAREEWMIETVLSEVRRIATSDIRDLFTEGGGIKPVSEWPDHVASCIASMDVVEEFSGSGKNKEQIGWNKKVKLWDKHKSLDMLGKYLRLFVERHEHTGKLTLESLKIGRAHV